MFRALTLAAFEWPSTFTAAWHLSVRCVLQSSGVRTCKAYAWVDQSHAMKTYAQRCWCDVRFIHTNCYLQKRKKLFFVILTKQTGYEKSSLCETSVTLQMDGNADPKKCDATTCLNLMFWAKSTCKRHHKNKYRPICVIGHFQHFTFKFPTSQSDIQEIPKPKKNRLRIHEKSRISSHYLRLARCTQMSHSKSAHLKSDIQGTPKSKKFV